jgi:hypothetical protein
MRRGSLAFADRQGATTIIDLIDLSKTTLVVIDDESLQIW